MYGKGKVEILKERTFKEFNVDTTLLKEGSHHKIYVKCIRCVEEFIREYRYLFQLHNCPCYKTREDGVILKWCNHCEQFLIKDQFCTNSSRYDNLSSWCAACQKDTPTTKRHYSKQKLLRHMNFEYWLKHFITAKRSRCKAEGIKFNLDFQSLQ